MTTTYASAHQAPAHQTATPRSSGDGQARPRRNRPSTRAGRLALTEAAAQARIERSKVLILLHEGGINLETLLAMARDHDPASMRRIKLYEILEALPGITSAKRDQVLHRIGTMFEVRGRAANLTLDWLLNRRSDGRRIEAFVNAIADHDFGPGQTIWNITRNSA